MQFAAGREPRPSIAQNHETMAKPLRSITKDEVARHATPDDFWLIVDGRVLDLTRFLAMHPGKSAWNHVHTM